MTLINKVYTLNARVGDEDKSVSIYFDTRVAAIYKFEVRGQRITRELTVDDAIRSRDEMLADLTAKE
jgi:hypothetical protein